MGSMKVEQLSSSGVKTLEEKSVNTRLFPQTPALVGKRDEKSISFPLKGIDTSCQTTFTERYTCKCTEEQFPLWAIMMNQKELPNSTMAIEGFQLCLIYLHFRKEMKNMKWRTEVQWSV